MPSGTPFAKEIGIRYPRSLRACCTRATALPVSPGLMGGLFMAADCRRRLLANRGEVRAIGHSLRTEARWSVTSVLQDARKTKPDIQRKTNGTYRFSPTSPTSSGFDSSLSSRPLSSLGQTEFQVHLKLGLTPRSPDPKVPPTWVDPCMSWGRSIRRSSRFNEPTTPCPPRLGPCP